MGRNIDNVGGIAQAAANAGTPINRRNIRLLDTGSVTWTAVDDPGNDEVEVSAVATGAGGAPTGSVMDFAGTTPPSGWLECDGAAVNRITFAALFAAIGITWGPGDGVNTFNVPDLRRRTTVGRGGTGTGTLGNAVGDVGGAETHTLSSAEMPSHSHGVSDPSHSHPNVRQGGNPLTAVIGLGPTYTPGYFAAGNSGAGVIATGALVDASTTGISIVAAGSGGAHNNIQPSAVMMKIIKT